MLYVDAVCIKGETRSFNCTINTSEDGGSTFNPLDLSEYHVKFRVLGSPTSDSNVLLEKIITQDTLLEVEGQITVPANGEFVFTINKEDTNELGLGAFPISIQLVGADDNDLVYTLTEGGQRGEFNKLRIVQV